MPDARLTIKVCRGREMVNATTTERELGMANISRACSRLRSLGEFVMGDVDRFATWDSCVYLVDDDLHIHRLLINDAQIAALVDAGNALIHGKPLRPMTFRDFQNDIAGQANELARDAREDQL